MRVVEIKNRWSAADGMVQPLCYWERQMVMNILDITKGLFCMCIKPFHLEQITYPWFQPLPLKQPYRVIWRAFQISLFKLKLPFSIWILLWKLIQVKVEWSHCGRSPILNFSHSIWNSQGDLVGISNLPLQIGILLDKQVYIQVKLFHLKNVAQPLLVPPSIFWV